MTFNDLHQQPCPLLLANVWDASSAQAAEQAGYAALGTSSAAIAAQFGYADGEAMPFAHLLFMVERIRAVSDLPLSVDLEAGYGRSAEEIAQNIQQLIALGVVGINLEDSQVVNGIRSLVDPLLFARQLQTLVSLLPAGFFFNIRTDTFLLGVDAALQETLRRGELYADHGANGLFVPGVKEDTDIITIAGQVALPLNVMAVPGLADIAALSSWGVRRISTGNFLHQAIQARLKTLLSGIQRKQVFEEIFCDENQ
ncbi:isocitrate lyase/PEP mutase family protein [Kosakonia cowanii]|uniref:isocitrate lyase/PEP mutase family protein n=1 Tax=Kosakonia cowanii TaxID=208223 RepID=UPI00289A99A9|nr:isocitrate lyase/phosphoenolpyruvate mutase family protein [Kosakonia cowanii]